MVKIPDNRRRGNPSSVSLTPPSRVNPFTSVRVFHVEGRFHQPGHIEQQADRTGYRIEPDAVGELSEQLFRMLIDVSSGQLTNAEIIGHQEFAIHRVGPTVGHRLQQAC